jgi:hypothetical protein
VRATTGADAVITTYAVRRGVLTSIFTFDQTLQVPQVSYNKLAEDRLEERGGAIRVTATRGVPRRDHPNGRGPARKGRLMWFGSPPIPLTCVTEDVAGYLADAVDLPGVEGQRIDMGGTGR